MNNSICTLFDNILIDIHKFKSHHSVKDTTLKLHGELLGTLVDVSDFSIIGNETNTVFLESRKWMLPKNGAVIMIM